MCCVCEVNQNKVAALCVVCLALVCLCVLPCLGRDGTGGLLYQSLLVSRADLLWDVCCCCARSKSQGKPHNKHVSLRSPFFSSFHCLQTCCLFAAAKRTCTTPSGLLAVVKVERTQEKAAFQTKKKKKNNNKKKSSMDQQKGKRRK